MVGTIDCEVGTVRPADICCHSAVRSHARMFHDLVIWLAHFSANGLAVEQNRSTQRLAMHSASATSAFRKAEKRSRDDVLCACAACFVRQDGRRVLVQCTVVGIVTIVQPGMGACLCTSIKLI